MREVEKRGEDARIVVEARIVTEGSRDGDSVAVNGVCLTALDVRPDSFAADISKETLLRSTLGNLAAGSPVNLERAVTPVTRLGGHPSLERHLEVVRVRGLTLCAVTEVDGPGLEGHLRHLRPVGHDCLIVASLDEH